MRTSHLYIVLYYDMMPCYTPWWDYLLRPFDSDLWLFTHDGHSLGRVCAWHTANRFTPASLGLQFNSDENKRDQRTKRLLRRDRANFSTQACLNPEPSTCQLRVLNYLDYKP